jgi:hypothetical protein
MCVSLLTVILTSVMLLVLVVLLPLLPCWNQSDFYALFHAGPGSRATPDFSG